MKTRTKISVLIIFIFSIYVSIIQAQVDTLWTKTFGGTDTDVGQSVQQTTDAGYIITGYTYSFGAGMGDVWLIKTDSCGNASWTKTFGGSDRDEGYSVKQTSDSGYIIVGSTKSFGSGDYDFWLIKTNADGDELWTKTFGGTGLDIGSSVQQTTDGGYIIVGWTSSFGSGDYDFLLIKTNADGDELWTKTFGGTGSDVGRSVQQTADGGYVMTGYTESFGYSGDVWLIKTDALGDSLWTKSFDCGNTTDYGVSVQQTIDEGYIITGDKFTFGPGYHDVLLIKTDSYGNPIWTKSYGGNDSETGRSVQQTRDGGYIITGGGDAGIELEEVWLIKTNDVGDTLWTKTFGGSSSDWGNSVQQTKDGGYIITGITESFGYGSSDVWLIKTTPDTTIVPVELTSFTATTIVNEINLNWSTATETNNSGFEILRIAQNDNDKWNTIGFVPGFGTTTEAKSYSYTDSKVSAGKYTYRLKQIDFDGSFEYSQEVEVEVSAPLTFSLEQNYPNPFNPSTKISWQVPIGSWQTLKIYDVLGNEVATLVDEYKPAGSYEVEWNANGFPSGVYFYQLLVSALQSKDGRAENYIETKKMILLK
jgi:hypothetical protein